MNTEQRIQESTGLAAGSNAAPAEASRASAGEIYCPGCNYNLRGVEADRCPECGLDIVEVRQRKSLIPWVHREEIGRVRAYWRTVRLVSFNSRTFVGEVARPAHLTDAKLFRRVTIPVAFLPFVPVAGIASYFTIRNGSASFGDALFLYSISLFGLLCCIALLTVIPFYALRSKLLDPELQHRTAVLCLYAASANLAWNFIVCALFVAGIVFNETSPQGSLGVASLMLAVLVFVAILGMTINDVVALIKQALKNTQATALQSLKIIALCSAGTVFTLFGVPFAIFYFGVIYYSLG